MKHPATEENEKAFSITGTGGEACQYVKDMGYTHVELMGIAEHPLTVPGDIRSPVIMRLLPAMEHPRISNICRLSSQTENRGYSGLGAGTFSQGCPWTGEF